MAEISNLGQIYNNYLIYLDSSIIKSKGFQTFLEDYFRIHDETSTTSRLYIPRISMELVVAEGKAILSKNSSDEDGKRYIRAVRDLMLPPCIGNYSPILAETSSEIAIIRAEVNDRMKFNTAIISNNLKFIQDCNKSFNHSKSVFRKKVLFMKLKNDGEVLTYSEKELQAKAPTSSQNSEKTVLKSDPGKPKSAKNPTRPPSHSRKRLREERDLTRACKKVVKLMEPAHFTMTETRYPISSTPNTPIKVNHPVTLGDTIKAGANTLKLVKVMGHGGEATLYTTNANNTRTGRPFIAKIFYPDRWTEVRRAKIKLLIEKKMASNRDFYEFAFPYALVQNEQGEDVGYLLERMPGKTLSSVYDSYYLQSMYANWNRKDLAQLCITILVSMQKLHDDGIIMGDINDGNILVESPLKVYFIDTDSYQLNDLPCVMGTPEYTSPEALKVATSSKGCDYSKFLRLKTDDYFAIATMMFKVLTRGQFPYACQGDKTVLQDLMDGNFPYPVGKKAKDTKEMLDGDWIYLWSHISFGMKKAFGETFARKLVDEDGNEFENTKRLPEYRRNIIEWIDEFGRYYSVLCRGEKAFEEFKKSKGKTDFTYNELSVAIARGELNCDPVSLEIFPGDYRKRVKGICSIACEDCGKVRNIDYKCWKATPDKWKYCSDCAEKHKVACKRCGKLFPPAFLTNGCCMHCTVYERRTCDYPGCNETFEISEGEARFFKMRKLSLPKRCKKHRGPNATTMNVDELISFDEGLVGEDAFNANDDNKDEGYDKSCFLTTATCCFLGKSDDCEELQALRSFRDNWLAKQKGGLRWIADYYAIAPKIVENIHKNPKVESRIYAKLYTDYIVPCMNAVHRGNNEECFRLYVEMYTTLKSHYYNGPQLKFTMKCKTLRDIDTVYNSEYFKKVFEFTDDLNVIDDLEFEDSFDVDFEEAPEDSFDVDFEEAPEDVEETPDNDFEDDILIPRGTTIDEVKLEDVEMVAKMLENLEKYDDKTTTEESFDKDFDEVLKEAHAEDNTDYTPLSEDEPSLGDFDDSILNSPDLSEKEETIREETDADYVRNRFTYEEITNNFPKHFTDLREICGMFTWIYQYSEKLFETQNITEMEFQRIQGFLGKCESFYTSICANFRDNNNDEVVKGFNHIYSYLHKCNTILAYTDPTLGDRDIIGRDLEDKVKEFFEKYGL